MSRPPLEVADVVRQHGAAFLARSGPTLSGAQHRALRAKPRQHILYASGHLSRPEFSGENFRLERHVFPPNMDHILHGVMFGEK